MNWLPLPSAATQLPWPALWCSSISFPQTGFDFGDLLKELQRENVLTSTSSVSPATDLFQAWFKTLVRTSKALNRLEQGDLKSKHTNFEPAYLKIRGALLVVQLAQHPVSHNGQIVTVDSQEAFPWYYLIALEIRGSLPPDVEDPFSHHASSHR